MLKNLKIKNVAVVEDAFIEFDNGLNIISGETGAGKSVILDALMLSLGAKADKGLIKSGEDFLKVEATFVFDENCNKIKEFFNEIDFEFEDCIIISRKISIDGKNETKINNISVPVSYLKNLASFILDIHSQNENLVLLNKNKQLELIDNFAKIDKQQVEFYYKELNKINEQIKEFDKDEVLRERELELLNYQINEIENANIQENEEEELTSERIMLKNCEKISNSLNQIKDLFEISNFNILSLIRKAENELSYLNNINDCSSLLDRVTSAGIELNDIYAEILNKYNFEFDQERFDEIDERLDLYKKLHRKYGESYSVIIEFLNACKEKRDALLNSEEILKNLRNNKKQILEKAFKECLLLQNKRIETANCLEKNIQDELHELSMPNAKIKFSISIFNEEDFEQKFTLTGANNVEILFSANLGESVKPLNLVASGGEISRLMLAIKTITTKFDETPTIIFDELDTGISGDASIATSKKLAKIAKSHQVIAISHLLQICSMADRNILVKKIEENDKTISTINILKPEETVLELCRFMSVNGITESTLKHAQEVKDYCENYKKSI